MGRQVLQLEQRLLAEVNIEEMHSYTQRAPTVQSIPGTLVDNIFYCTIWWLFPCLVFTLPGKIPFFSYKKIPAILGPCVSKPRVHFKSSYLFGIKVCRKIRTK